MASTSTPYSSAPAFPTLAHFLLPQPHHGQVSTPGTWDLKDDIRNAFKSPAHSVFRKGTVIGFSNLRDQAKENDDIEILGQVSRSILAAQLCKTSAPSSFSAKAYIIHPANLDIFSPQRLLESLLSASQQPPLSRNEAVSRLDHVQLFPVFDMAAAAQSIGEVSGALHRYKEEQESRQNHQAESTGNSDCSIFLLIAGLDTLTEGVVRASSIVRGTAILSNILRTLTQLSRMHSPYLSVMLINTSGLGTMTSNMHVAPGQMQQRRNPGYKPQTSLEDGLQSIFHASERLFPSLLMRTLEQGIDAHLLLSTVKSAHVVEVIKDRVGNGVGRWCMWDKRIN
ncbi:hypothetical protein BDV38DRAFT_279563 [Aspergillus pseudotamarii]|uniref:Uncharacterized protein n=1 Tax=Aspergillus pseudotamarii TaxID=132259 RepID=A0A5N6T491_ASPPS|nr:uncharacterized protein BDV38DRAFT_279563 [Aspergillus pseudotamarii]KAE8141117.1 hypothetical protein BDV38DRAFT_279563 [Aspergillus pseudotamarii]